MYETYFKFRRKPFATTPDPRFFFNSSTHKLALGYLRFGLRRGEGAVIITGNLGTGKTILTKVLARDLRKSNLVAAHVVYPTTDTQDFLPRVVEGFGIDPEGLTESTMVGALERHFRQRYAEGRRCLLIIDEAQNLPVRAIEELQILSDYRAGERPLLQSFLLGQASLRRAIRAPEFDGLRQRSSAAYHLNLLSQEETIAYTEHRLRLVGWEADPSIAVLAYAEIYHVTLGVPLRINLLMDHLLTYCCLEGLHEIRVETVNTVAGTTYADVEPDA